MRIAVVLILGWFAVLTAASQSTQTLVKDYQACMRCHFAQAGAPTKCPNCGAKRITVRGKEVRVCPRDHETFRKSVKNCPKHKVALGARILTYYCKTDQTSSSQAGNCRTCGKFRTKHLLMTSPPKPGRVP